MSEQDNRRVIVALDGLGERESLGLAEKLGKRPYAYKIHDLWDWMGPSAVAELRASGAERVWVDLKLHDIPKAVELRTKAVLNSGAAMLTVHASGEIEMMKAAVKSADYATSIFGFQIIAITVLTSLNEEQAHLLHGQPVKAAVLALARRAKLAGVHGIVCSPQEVGILAKRPELQGLKFITPGVRSFGKDAADQKRVDTPAAAIKAGADYLVIGREITQAPDPLEALEAIEEQITSALEERSRT